MNIRDYLSYASGVYLAAPMAVGAVILYRQGEPIFSVFVGGMAVGAFFLPEYIRSQLPSKLDILKYSVGYLSRLAPWSSRTERTPATQSPTQSDTDPTESAAHPQSDFPADTPPTAPQPGAAPETAATGGQSESPTQTSDETEPAAAATSEHGDKTTPETDVETPPSESSASRFSGLRDRASEKLPQTGDTTATAEVLKRSAVNRAEAFDTSGLSVSAIADRLADAENSLDRETLTAVLNAPRDKPLPDPVYAKLPADLQATFDEDATADDLLAALAERTTTSRAALINRARNAEPASETPAGDADAATSEQSPADTSPDVPPVDQDGDPADPHPDHPSDDTVHRE